MTNPFKQLSEQLEQHLYIADDDLVTTLSLMQSIERLLLNDRYVGVNTEIGTANNFSPNDKMLLPS